MNKQGLTTRNVTMNYHGSQITVPAGTRVLSIMCGLGPEWAIESERLVADLSRDKHSARYYHAWIPADAVKADA